MFPQWHLPGIIMGVAPRYETLRCADSWKWSYMERTVAIILRAALESTPGSSIEHFPSCRPVKVSDPHTNEFGGCEVGGIHTHRGFALLASVRVVRDATTDLASMVIPNAPTPGIFR
jgi:hypothetical protein